MMVLEEEIKHFLDTLHIYKHSKNMCGENLVAVSNGAAATDTKDTKMHCIVNRKKNNTVNCTCPGCVAKGT